MKRWCRKGLYAVAALAALLASGPLLPLEMALFFSGELLLYLEIVSGVWLASRASGCKAALIWLKERPAQLRRNVRVEWPRRHPTLTSWLHWTFACI
jgi:hypothetical protein